MTFTDNQIRLIEGITTSTGFTLRRAADHFPPLIDRTRDAQDLRLLLLLNIHFEYVREGLIDEGMALAEWFEEPGEAYDPKTSRVRDLPFEPHDVG